MHTIRWNLGWFCCGLLLAGLMIGGCDDDNGGGGSGSNLHTFTVDFGGTTDDQLWVVRHSLQSGAAIAVMEVPSSGIAAFDSIPESRVSFTTIRQYESGAYSLNSYLNVPAGDWVFGSMSPTDSLGTVELTVNYPAGIYSEGRLTFPGNSVYFSWPVDTTRMRILQTVWYLDNDRFSVYGHLTGATVDYCGSLMSEPFQVGDTNRYTLDVTQAMARRTVATNRPTNAIFLSSYRQGSDFSYNGYSSIDWDEARSSWDVPYCELPVDEHQLVVWNNLGEVSFGYLEMLTELPSSLTIPTWEVTATYDEAQGSFQNIQAGGPVDLLEAAWFDVDNSIWTVTSAMATRLSRPGLPDSLRTLLNLPAFEVRWLNVSDWDSFTSIDDYVRAYCRGSNQRPVYHREYSTGLRFGNPSAAEQRTPPFPAPLRQTFEHDDL